MGVPSFFKWLARKYPKILKNAVEQLPETAEDGSLVYQDTSLPNPNDYEYDCLYDI
jgi:5'-3' exoribonuclease 2